MWPSLLEQELIRLLLDAFRSPDPVIITGEELASHLATQGRAISRPTVVTLIQTLEARGYVRLIPMFSVPFDVIVTGIAPQLSLLVPPPADGGMHVSALNR